MKSFFRVVLTAGAGLVLTHAGLEAQPPDAGCSPQPCKVCVSEPKHNTRKVYACKAEEYCLPRCDWLSLLWEPCGCDEGTCGDLRVRHRLVVKKAPDCDTKQCVPRALPLAAPAPCAPAAAAEVPQPPACIQLFGRPLLDFRITPR